MPTRMTKHQEIIGYRYEELSYDAQQNVQYQNVQDNYEMGWEFWEYQFDFLIELLEKEIGGATVRHGKNDWVIDADGTHRRVRKDPDIHFEIDNRGGDGGWFSADFDLPDFFEGMAKAEEWVSNNVDMDVNKVGKAMLQKHQWIIDQCDGKCCVGVEHTESNWYGHNMTADSAIEDDLSWSVQDMRDAIEDKYEAKRVSLFETHPGFKELRGEVGTADMETTAQLLVKFSNDYADQIKVRLNEYRMGIHEMLKGKSTRETAVVLEATSGTEKYLGEVMQEEFAAEFERQITIHAIEFFHYNHLGEPTRGQMDSVIDLINTFYDLALEEKREIVSEVYGYERRVEAAVESLHDDILDIAKDFGHALYKWLVGEVEYWGTDEYAKDNADANDHWYDENGKFIWDFIPQEEVNDDEEVSDEDAQ